MHEQLRLYVCHECAKEFLLEQHLQEHKKESGHWLFTSREMDEYPVPLDTDGITKLGNDFNPSVTTLQRIMNSLVQKGPISRTNLAQASNVHYSRLSKYLVLLTYRNYIQYSMCDGKVTLRLTARGKTFADNLMQLYNWENKCAGDEL